MVDRARRKHDISVRCHIITDDAILAQPRFLPLATELIQALPHRVALHMRAHEMPAANLFRLTEQLCALHPRAAVYVNDRVDIAAATTADGVQLTARSLPISHARDLLGAAAGIGYSAHGAEEAAQAEADGADFLIVGTIYRSATHADAAPAGIDLIRRVASRCRLPILAIGGVTGERVPEVRAAGAHGVAVISAVWAARDPVQAARDLARLVED